jgi:acyl carrier protein
MPETDSIAGDVKRFVVENFLFGQTQELANTQSFLDAALIDSTGVLELVGFIEQRYRITVEDRELVPDNLDSIENVTQFVQRKLQAQDRSLES